MHVKFEIFKDNKVIARTKEIIDCRFSDFKSLEKYCLNSFNKGDVKANKCKITEDFPKTETIPMKVIHLRSFSYDTIR